MIKRFRLPNNILLLPDDKNGQFVLYKHYLKGIETVRTESRAEALREAADRAWPLLKQEYEWRHEDSECGGDEVSEGLDILKSRLISAITQEADK
jgi:hypothetical protein